MAEGDEIIQQATETLVNTLRSVLPKEVGDALLAGAQNAEGGFIKSVTDAIAKAGPDAAKSLIDDIGSSLSNISFKVALEAVSDLDMDKVQKKLAQFKDQFEKSDAAQYLASLGIDTSTFTPMLDMIQESLAPFANVEVAAKIASFGVSEAGVKALKSAAAPLVELEEKVLAVDRAALKAAAGFVPPVDADAVEKGGTAYDNVRESVDFYRNQLIRLNAATRLSQETIEAEIDTVRAAGLSFREVTGDLQDLTVDFDNAKGNISGFEAVMTVARGAGIEMTDMAQDLAFATKTLGLTATEATERVGAFAEVSAGSRVTVDEVRKNVNEVTKSLRFYGDTTKGVSAIYKRFLDGMGTGREALAAELFQDVATSIGDMDVGLKAFLGTAGGIGGGRGALGGALEVEQAIAEGDISGVMDKITEQIEQISGAGIMTREEALDTGQEQQFFLQRELLKQFGIAGKSDEQATKILEAIAKGEEVQVSDIQEERGLRATAETGAARMRAEAGVAGGAINVAEVTSQLATTRDISAALAKSGGLFDESSDKLLKSVEGFERTIRALGKDSQEVSKKNIEATQKMQDTADEQLDMAEKADVKVAGVDVVTPGVAGVEITKPGVAGADIERPGVAAADVAGKGVAGADIAPPESVFKTTGFTPLGESQAIDPSIGAQMAARTARHMTQQPGVGAQDVSMMIETVKSSGLNDQMTSAIVTELQKIQQEMVPDGVAEATAGGNIEVRLFVDGKEFRTIAAEVTRKELGEANKRALSPGQGR